MSAWGTNVVVSEEKPVATTCSYEIGEDIVYDGSNYYVLQDLNDYVLALKEDPLTSEEINIYSSDYVSQDGEYPYYKSDTCNISIKPWGEEIFDNDIGCTTDYNQSNIKELIDNWSNEYSNDLKEVDGYKARLITKDEVVSFLNFEILETSSNIKYEVSSDTPDWATVRDKPYWSMTEYEDSSSSVYVVYSQIWQTDIPKLKYVRPVINLKKSAIESECNMNNSNKIYYSIGEKISYNNSNYCVINSSKLSEDYVTLIKSDPLTYDELIEYNNGYEIGRDNEDNNVGIISYYKNDDCYYNSDYDKNITGCSSNYDTSNIKNVIDNWSNSFNNDLKEVDGYKVRLIKYGELKDIGYESVMHGTAFYLESSNSTKCVGFKTWYDGGNIVPTVSGTHGISELNPVRPVINLKKCALTNTCE